MGKGRAPCCDKSKVRTGPWSTAEDLRLTNFIQKNGHTNWRALPKLAGLLRCGKSCRLRWVNYLSPDVKRGNFSPEEEQTIIDMHNSIGNKWSKIASCLPGRTDNEIKNVWNTKLKKRVTMNVNKNGELLSAAASSPCSSSSNSTTTIGDRDQNMEEMDRVKKPDEKPESDSFVSTSDHNELPKQELGYSVTNPEADKSELVEIPSDIDDDLWELLNSLDPLQINNEDKIFNGEDVADQVSEWLRLLENNESKDQQIMNLEPEISVMGLDYSSIWPCLSPSYLGI